MTCGGLETISRSAAKQSPAAAVAWKRGGIRPALPKPSVARTSPDVVRHGALLGVTALARAIADQPSGQTAMLRPLAALHKRLETPDLMGRERAFGALALGGLRAPNQMQQRIEEGDK